MTQDEKLAMVEAMRSYGGNFIRSLAECFLTADPNNLKRLCEAFPDYVQRYREMAEIMPE